MQNEEETLRKELQKLQDADAAVDANTLKLKALNLEKHNGLLWKRMSAGVGVGFEPNPYCPECPTHPVMAAQGSHGAPRLWVCPNGHPFQRSGKPSA